MGTTVWFLLLPLVSAQTVGKGPCPSPPVKQNFNVLQFLGQWYEIEKIPVTFEVETCVTIIYVLRKDGMLQVWKTSEIHDRWLQILDGTASFPDLREHAKLALRFSHQPTESNHWVLTTDYSNLSIMYSCTSFLDFWHLEYTWILSCFRTLPSETLDYAKDLLRETEIDTSTMKATDQTNCLGH
ncbi:apolipoprotein D-like [Thalassophryne amazonica]|uniref:apolipoprotein D-like n=1 Tax=Thalassophryne amazonica TaxID=390379 RepID=UPI00147143DE|nr:apolipoprotein D-like [Thalassophryne amazonica]